LQITWLFLARCACVNSCLDKIHSRGDDLPTLAYQHFYWLVCSMFPELEPSSAESEGPVSVDIVESTYLRDSELVLGHLVASKDEHASKLPPNADAG
jgi:hypothetical protein